MTETEGVVTPSPGCGHVFILHCHSVNLAADAVLLPNTDVPELEDAGLAPDGKTHIFNAPVLQQTGEDLIAASEGIAAAYFEQAAALLDGNSAFGRCKPLLALPLFECNSSEPESKGQEGEFIATHLALCYKAVDQHHVDIALCTTSSMSYNVMQVRRAALCPFDDGPFWMLNDHLRKEATRLSEKLLAGSLSVFFGAGVSYPSGNPGWNDLLKKLAVDAGFSEDEQAGLLQLDYLDRATLIEREMGPKKFRKATKEQVSVGKFTPAHAILAAMDIPAGTTNYDDLYERTAEEGVIKRLPWDSGAISGSLNRGTRYVTKLHGCITHPKSIVLTREDYLRYGDRRTALRGLIHQLLLTTHIMFVGFSMTDDNMHLIIDQTREALESRQNRGDVGILGTVFSLTENEMFRRLWSDEFHITTFGASYADDPAWYHDAFFDCIQTSVAKSRALTSFVLDPDYEVLLSDAEKKIRNALADILNLSTDESVTASPAWRSVADLLERLGAVL